MYDTFTSLTTLSYIKCHENNSAHHITNPYLLFIPSMPLKYRKDQETPGWFLRMFRKIKEILTNPNNHNSHRKGKKEILSLFRGHIPPECETGNADVYTIGRTSAESGLSGLQSGGYLIMRDSVSLLDRITIINCFAVSFYISIIIVTTIINRSVIFFPMV